MRKDGRGARRSVATTTTTSDATHDVISNLTARSHTIARLRGQLTKSSMSDSDGSAADWLVEPHIYENQIVFTGDNYTISQIRVDDIEEILDDIEESPVTIDKVDRTQPFKLTISFNTYGTPSAWAYITGSLKKFCHLDIHVGLFYHSKTAACVGYINSLRAKRHFEYRPSDGNSLPCIPKVFLDRFSIEHREYF